MDYRKFSTIDKRMMNVHDETEDLFNEYMRNQEDNQDN